MRDKLVENRDAKNLKLYVFLTYVIFWVLIAITAAMISLGVPELILTIVKNIVAWTPTFVILIMFKKLYPGITFKEYLKTNFATRINPWMFLLSVLLQVSIVAASVILFFLFNNTPLNTMTYLCFIFRFE